MGFKLILQNRVKRSPNTVLYLDEKGVLKQYCISTDLVTQDVIRQYKNLFCKLENERLSDCYIMVKSEATRLDSYLPTVNMSAGTMLVLMFTLLISLESRLITLNNTIGVLLFSFVGVLGYSLFWANKNDSRKRQHYNIMESILEDMIDVERLNSKTK